MRPHGNRVIHEKMRKGQRGDSSLANPEVASGSPRGGGAPQPAPAPPATAPEVGGSGSRAGLTDRPFPTCKPSGACKRPVINTARWSPVFPAPGQKLRAENTV